MVKFLSILLQHGRLPGERRGDKAPLFREVRDHVLALIRDKIIVGHSLWQFLSASNDTLPVKSD
jgi:hypothetical protein